MSDEPTPLQLAIRRAIADSGKKRDFFDAQIREKTKTTGKPIYDIDRGKSKNPSAETLQAIADVMGLPVEYFTRPGQSARVADPEPPTGDVVDTVGIQHIDQAYGLGATFTDNPVEIDVLQFPKIWVDSITSTSPYFLTWTRGRGDSMEPTIRDGDLVLLDRSRRRVDEQDALWAFTIGDVGAIKRLRVKGDRFQIFSDNPSVNADEEPIDFVNIVGRVIFVGMRK
jgi:phage repressor protein C with HTH and peptisase S24 domain